VLHRYSVAVLAMAAARRLRRNPIARRHSIARAIGRTARLTEMVVDRAEHRARHGGPETG
jgi:hypothetical protein